MPLDISVKSGIVENIHIGVTCSSNEVQAYTSLFHEFHDIFAWSYIEIPSIDPSIVVLKYLLTLARSLFASIFVRCTLEKLLPLKVKLKNFSEMVPFIQFL